MKRKDKEHLKNMSEAELKVQLRDLGKHLFHIKFKRASTPLENPIEIRLVRRKMALIRTCLGAAERATAKAGLTANTSEVKH